MNRILGAVALGLATVMGTAGAAHAEVPLSMLTQIGGLPSLAPLLKQVTPGVVGIVVTAPQAQAAQAAKTSRDRQRQPKPAAQHEERAGSGVVVDAGQGLILTNNHVIDQASAMTVLLDDGRRLNGKLVGVDPGTDLAVIKVSTDKLTAVMFSDSDQLQVGDFVIAIGNPQPMGRSVTSGIVSGLRRSNIGLAEAEDFVQTDAAIYPGDSGGALINLRGELVGINTGYIGASSGNSGMGFAIPANLARKVIDQILEFGSVRRGTIGVTFGDQSSNGLQLGAVIEKVETGSPADRAGLKVGDVVTAIDGVSVHDADELHGRMGLDWLGDTIVLTVTRGGNVIVVRATTA